MKEKLSTIYKMLILIISGIGLYLNFKLLDFDCIVYFTILSNIMVFMLYLFIVLKLFFKINIDSNKYYLIKGFVTMAISITMIVYTFLIAGTDALTSYIGHQNVGNFVHVYTPLLVIFDYILFDEKHKVKKNYPFIWSLILLFYFVFVKIYVLFGGLFEGGNTYPYEFMNVERLGLMKTALSYIVIYMTYVCVGLVIYYIDNYGFRKGIQNGIKRISRKIK